MVIFSAPIVKLAALDKELTAEFIQALLKDIPALGKENPTHFILNNNIGVFNPQNLKHVHLFNNFLQLSRQKADLLQIVK